MTLVVRKKNESTVRDIYAYQVLSKKVKVIIKIGEKTTIEKNLFKEKKVTESEFEEEVITLGKDMILTVDDGRKNLYTYDSEVNDCEAYNDESDLTCL